MVGSDVDDDTDAISITSSAKSQLDQVYEVKCILAEGWGKDNDDSEVKKFLIEWEGYPMEDCTWEPKYNVFPTLLNSWEKRKARMGPEAFQKFTDDNEARFEQAMLEKRQRLQAIKKQKRAEKRNKLRDSSSDDDVPLRQQSRASQAKSKSSEAVPTHSQEVYNSLFVDSQDSNPLGPPPALDQLERDSAVGAPPAARTPFVESSTDDGDTTTSDDSSDSLLAEIASKAENQTRLKSRDKRVAGLGNSILAPTRSRRKATNPSPQSAAPATNQKTVEAAVQNPAKLMRTLTAPVVSNTPDSAVVKQLARRPSESAARVSTATTIGAASVQKSAVATTTASARKSPVSGAAPSSRKIGTASKAAPPIKFTNQKKEPLRSKWDTKDILYNKLHFRGKAQQRSRYEGTPDPTVLEFVGPGPSNLVKPKPSHPVDDPYSRRETGNRRVESSDEDESTGWGSRQDLVPMHDWEKDKIPLVCPQWRLSSNCEFGRILCRYLHRNKDGNGRDIDVAPIDGHIPPKYGKPPVTCPYWLRQPKGCHKKDAECDFAHHNTGWIPNSIRNAAPMPVDPQERPVSEQKRDFAHLNTGRIPSTSCNTVPIPMGPNQGSSREQRHDFARPSAGLISGTKRNTAPVPTGPREGPSSEQRQNFARPSAGLVSGTNLNAAPYPVNPKEGPWSGQRPSFFGKKADKTCWYWANGGCEKPDETCSFKHYHTGVVAPLKPRPESSKSPLPCYFFLKGTCIYTAEQCKFTHIDPNQRNAEHNTIARTTQGPRQQFTAVHASRMQNDEAVDTQMLDADEQQSVTLRQPTVDAFKPPTAPPRTVPASSNMKLKIEKALKMDFSHMFQWSQDGGKKNMLDRKAFLLYHPVDNQAELELMTRWLLLNHVEVSNARFEGAWEQYARELVQQKSKSGILVVHPDFDFFSKLKDFGKVLRNQVRVWSVGMQESIEYDPALSLPPPKKRQECIELFPAGGFIYITDDVFEAQPRQALQIVKLFLAKTETLRDPEHAQNPWQEVDNINLHWRLCVRPELMEYLFAKCEEQANVLEAGEPDAVARAELYTLLSDTEYIEQDSPVMPLSHKADKFPIMSERRAIAKEEPINYFNALARSHEKANLRMIRYYTALHTDLRRDYRHFYIVHTDPYSTPAKQWLRECATITDIISPERCIAELSKDCHDGEERWFDFYEKYLMPTNDNAVSEQVKQVTRIQNGDMMDSQSSLESGELRSS